MADYAHEETERQLKELEDKISEVYSQASQEMGQTITEYFQSFETRDAKESQRLADGEITESEYTQWRKNQIGRGERYEKMRDNLAERATEANETAVAYVNDATPSIYSLNRNFEAYEIESAGADIAFDIWDEQTVKRLIVEDPDLMPNYPEEKAIKRGIDLAYGKQQITASVTSGILQGKSLTKIANDLQSRITTMSRTSAVRAARTAFTQAQNAGRQDTMEAAEDMGIKMEKVWLATLDANTRPEHAEADGQRVGVKDTFIVGGERMEYPGDRAGSGWNVYNCRCTMVSVPEGMDLNNAQRWARDPVTGERSLVSNMTYKDWYDWRTKAPNMSYQAYQDSLKPKEEAPKEQKSIDKNARALLNKLKSSKITYNEVKPLKGELSETQIINKIGGGDKTEGSCASQALAYVGNKIGLDVTDYRGGTSRSIFANSGNLNGVMNLEGVKTESLNAKNEIRAGKQLLNKMEEGKEYVLVCGQHCSVVSNIRGQQAYLELQSAQSNGWKAIKDSTLKNRFGASDSLYSRSKVTLTEIDSFKDNKDFQNILGYLNTETSQQQKGASGYAK